MADVLGKEHSRLVGEIAGGGVGQGHGLAAQRLGDALAAVADTGDGDAGGRVEVARSRVVPHVGALAAYQHGILAGHVAAEDMPSVHTLLYISSHGRAFSVPFPWTPVPA